MKRYFHIGLLYIFCNILTSCKGQTNDINQIQPVGGSFENSEFLYYGISKNISPTDTSPGWKQQGQKILLTGIVYQQDGKTPASNVLLYYYHTNTEGKYLHKPGEKRSMPPNELGQTHGYIRGWVRTDTKGSYSIYTVRPGTYPTNDEPAHIHITVKEPNNLKEYYIDDFVFDDDPLLTSAKRQKLENRCGSGILRMVQKGGLQIGERNLILGIHIPGYQKTTITEIKSGNDIGEDVFSFTPIHAWGPDKGTKTCPVCKYGWYHGILYFVGNSPDWFEIKQWLQFLETESILREKYLKVYFIYGNNSEYNKRNREHELEQIGKDLHLEKIALTFVPSFSDTESEINLNHISQTADNTFILYKRSRIISKYINLKPGDINFSLVKQQLDHSINEYFDLPQPHYN